MNVATHLRNYAYSQFGIFEGFYHITKKQRMNAIDAIKQMTGKYRVVRTDPLEVARPDESTCESDRADFGANNGPGCCSIRTSRSVNCYDTKDQASIDHMGVVRILVTAPSGRVWLDTFTPNN